ncbi:MAG: hypothetical protein NTY41_16090 [Proteobacteria bacterium]|nr:hypothetical protein [Pseudomonadota bacterium]
MKSLLFLMLIAGTALANDAALKQCRGIPEATARLACYDAIVITPVEARQAIPAQSPAAQPSPQAPGQFGMESQAYKTELQTIESHIPGRFEGWQANSRLQLANGQVWQISDDSSATYDLQDPKVKIRRGMLGAFYLEIEGKNRSPKVRRLK